MTSREKILAAVKLAQPGFAELPEMPVISPADTRPLAGSSGDDLVQERVSGFVQMLTSIGGHAKLVTGYQEIIDSLRYQFADAQRIVSTLPDLEEIAEIYSGTDIIAGAEKIDVAVLAAHFGVAENGAVYLTEDIICDRVVPFICQHLVAVIKADSIVGDMFAAYDKIAANDYGYAIFVAGPSKTADIEQSLVLGAHGPVSMTVFILP